MFERGCFALRAGLLAVIALAAAPELQAAFNRSLIYGLNLESNSEEDDLYFSTLDLRLDDDFHSNRYQGQYDLESRLLYDHDESESNDQHRGRFDSQFFFRRPNAWWNLDATVEVLPVDRDSEIEEFNSQTLSRLSTGPELSLSRGIPGTVNLGAEVASVEFSESDLDSTQSEARVIYDYPLTQVSSTGVELRYRRLEYDDEINSVNDFDIASAGLYYGSRGRRFDYRILVDFSEVENRDTTIEQEGYDIDFGYAVNSASRVSLSLSESLQTAEIFNLLPGNLDDSRFESGLLRNERIELQYAYTYQNLSASVEIFNNKIENVVASEEGRDEIDGLGLRIANRFSEKLQIFALYRFSNTRSTDTDEEDLDIVLTYTERHSSRISSEISLFTEQDAIDDSYIRNHGVRLRLSVLLL